ncbi:MAG TPA: HAD family hydrolase [Candidatus Eisenbacteria bacterium]|nr:HAD family hydrolase [Candidatus Eisenbacteria bacterium]
MTAALPKAILLDMDDTILDDSGSTTRCWREACLAHQADLGGVDPVALHAAIDRNRAWFWSDPDRHRDGRLALDATRRELVRMSLTDLGVDASTLAVRIADDYAARRDRLIEPFPQAIETVQWLRESGCRLALLTNGNGAAQRSKIDRFGLGELFDVILVEGEVGFGKPDPRVYELALSGLVIEPSHTWMVGDNLEWDVAAPQRLGIFGIWVDRRGKGLPPEHHVRPNRIVRGLSELRSPNGSLQ